MRRHFLFSTVLGLLAGVATCTDGTPTEEETIDERSCEQLRDHLVDLQISDIALGTGVDREAHRAALTHALGGDFVSSCVTKLTASQAQCAIAATDSAAVAECAH